MTMEDFLASMYAVSDRDREPFGDHWCGPERFRPWEDTLVARYDSGDGDGQDVEIYCCAGPARFYAIRCLPGRNSDDDPREGWALGTGSGEARLAAELGRAVSQGMLGLHEFGVHEQS